jgi:hypothetical protein
LLEHRDPPFDIAGTLAIAEIPFRCFFNDNIFFVTESLWTRHLAVNVPAFGRTNTADPRRIHSMTYQLLAPRCPLFPRKRTSGGALMNPRPGFPRR